MKIALTGSHSTGKTTLIEQIKKLDQFKNYNYNKSIARSLSEEGLNINESGNDETQLCILLNHYHNAMMEGDIILDRCIIDGYCYTYYLYKNGKVSNHTLGQAEIAFNDLLKKYDYIFWLKSEFNVIEDGLRSCNKSFKTQVERIFIRILEHRDNVHILSGTVDERIKQMLNIINGG